MKKIKMAMLAILTTAAGSASALEAEDVFARLGASTEIPHEHTRVAGFVSDVAIERSGGAELSASYMLTPDIALGMMLTSQFSHQMLSHGAAQAVLGSYEVMYPTVTIQYHHEFGSFKPYVGAGVSYASFSNFDTNHYTLAGEKIDIDNAYAPAFEAGLDYKLEENTYINVSAVYLDLSTNAQVRGAGGNANIDLTIDPVMWNFALVHKF